jgi:hypothetical protein
VQCFSPVAHKDQEGFHRLRELLEAPGQGRAMRKAGEPPGFGGSVTLP